jgi:hypothetical protein
MWLVLLSAAPASHACWAYGDVDCEGGFGVVRDQQWNYNRARLLDRLYQYTSLSGVEGNVRGVVEGWIAHRCVDDGVALQVGEWVREPLGVARGHPVHVNVGWNVGTGCGTDVEQGRP